MMLGDMSQLSQETRWRLNNQACNSKFVVKLARQRLLVRHPVRYWIPNWGDNC
ncbi:unnamed protein product, partial [Linum tenue]